MMLDVTPPDPYAAAAASAARLVSLTGRADAAVVLGSGWAPAADAIGPAEAAIPLTEPWGFGEPTVAGHTPTVRSVRAGPLRVLVFLGRVHLYEGLPPATVVHGVRTAVSAGARGVGLANAAGGLPARGVHGGRGGVSAGARVVVLTNAAGGIRSGLTVGEPVLISDHLNLTGKSPLTGPAPSVGQRFVDLTDLYSPRLRALAREADPSLAEGVYAMLPGPHYETPAEITMLARLGADLAGMSTVLEAIAARQMGAEVLGISLVTNLAAGLAGHGLSHAEGVGAGRASASRMGALLAGILPRV